MSAGTVFWRWWVLGKSHRKEHGRKSPKKSSCTKAKRQERTGGSLKALVVLCVSLHGHVPVYSAQQREEWSSVVCGPVCSAHLKICLQQDALKQYSELCV